MNKRGSLGPGQIALLILVIVSFILIGIFMWGLFKNDDLNEREICHLSLLTRATLPRIIESAIPLNCHTDKICLTIDKNLWDIIRKKDNSCKQFAGEKNVRNVEVKIKQGMSIVQEKDVLETIQREVANAMFDCFKMTGEGKLDIFTNSYKPSKEVGEVLLDEGTDVIGLTVQQIQPRCIVCSRIAISDALIEVDKSLTEPKIPLVRNSFQEEIYGNEDRSILKRIDINRFLSREKVPGSSLTYVQTFTDESVGSGYSSIESEEQKLQKYVGKTEFSESDLIEIKEILKNQFKSRPAELEKISKLKLTSLPKYFESFVKSGASKDNQFAIVFTQFKIPQIDENDAFWKSFSTSALMGGASMFTSAGTLLTILIPGPGWAKATWIIGSIGVTSTVMGFNARSNTLANQALAPVVCGKFESQNKEGLQGCSLTKLVNWDVDTINNLCFGGIEGNL